ncbi:MAG: hypothetical protein CMN78_06430 [Spirochaetales bacterium]|nr:hypothetical protein [Spirochaetales bacterium]
MQLQRIFRRRFFQAAFFFFLSASLWSDSPLKDPGIPDGELAVYREEIEGEFSYFTEQVSVKERNGSRFYEIVSKSDDEITTLRIEEGTMLPFSINTITKGSWFVSENSTVIELIADFERSGIMLLSFDDLPYLLRGYPFEARTSVPVGFLQSSEDDDGIFDFDISVRFVDREFVSTADQQIDCYKLQLRFRASGVMKILNGMVPKTYFWYSVQPPHYLVAYEGSSGAPGSPKRHVKIVEYSDWAADSGAD